MFEINYHGAVILHLSLSNTPSPGNRKRLFGNEEVLQTEKVRKELIENMSMQ